MRLNRFLARAGVASRRGAERVIAAGRVRVDGAVVAAQGVRVDPERSVVEVDGRRVRLAAPVWLLLHKPPRVVCTRSDPRGRPTIYDLLPDAHRTLFHVGRLDVMSEGLLLLTNEGEVARELLHPSREVPRRYEVLLREPVRPGLARTLAAGVELEDGPARPEEVRVRRRRDGSSILALTLREGRNREVRRMLRALGVGIRRLRRVAFGPVELGGLAPGAWRRLEDREVESLRTLSNRN
ncbi:MAG: pseudouridine synthase [Gemmatimonadota bacterium]|nr:pseudouridine synthase [Gemmatimonadota bacterium]